MLQESCRRIAQLIQGMMTAWSCHIGRSSPAGSYPELPCTLGMGGGAMVPCNILNVHFELVAFCCADESYGHWISPKAGLKLSCHAGVLYYGQFRTPASRRQLFRLIYRVQRPDTSVKAATSVNETVLSH